MDNTALIAQVALEANLIRSRLNKIDAKIESNASPLGGVLKTETVTGLSESTKDGEQVVSVSIKVLGYPKGTAPDDAAKKTKPVFCIYVGAQGTYQLKSKIPPLLRGDKNLAYAFGRPIYLLAATEVRAIAVKMGFPGVRPDPDLARPDDIDNVELTEEDASFLGVHHNLERSEKTVKAASKPKIAGKKVGVRRSAK